MFDQEHKSLRNLQCEEASVWLVSSIRVDQLSTVCGTTLSWSVFDNYWMMFCFLYSLSTDLLTGRSHSEYNSPKLLNATLLAEELMLVLYHFWILCFVSVKTKILSSSPRQMQCGDVSIDITGLCARTQAPPSNPGQCTLSNHKHIPKIKKWMTQLYQILVGSAIHLKTPYAAHNNPMGVWMIHYRRTLRRKLFIADNNNDWFWSYHRSNINGYPDNNVVMK